MARRWAAAPRGPCGPWLCLLVALALDAGRGQREGRGGRDGARGWLGPRPGWDPRRARPRRALRAGETSPRDLAPAKRPHLLPSPRASRQLFPDPGRAGPGLFPQPRPVCTFGELPSRHHPPQARASNLAALTPPPAPGAPTPQSALQGAEPLWPLASLLQRPPPASPRTVPLPGTCEIRSRPPPSPKELADLGVSSDCPIRAFLSLYGDPHHWRRRQRLLRAPGRIAGPSAWALAARWMMPQAGGGR